MEYIIIAVSFFGIMLGADWLVSGSVSIAKRLKISEFVIGAAIVGIGTSMPELVVSVIGAANGNADIAIGNVVVLCLFMVFMSYSFYRDRKKAPEHEPVHEEAAPLWISSAKTVAGLAILAVSCDLFVSNAIKIAKSFGVNDAFISITLIACGTSLPELAASVTAALRKNTRLALGNIVGSNIFNITLILGLTPLITPLQASGITATDYLVMASAALMLPLISFRGKSAGQLAWCCFLAS